MGVSSQIVCVSSGELTSIILRAEDGGQKPDVTSFFDGFISLLPVASSPLKTSFRRMENNGRVVRNESAVDYNTQQQSSTINARGLSSAAAAAAGQSSNYEPDIKQLKHVLESINTTKTIAKISLTQQASVNILVTESPSLKLSHRSERGAKLSSFSTKTRQVASAVTLIQFF